MDKKKSPLSESSNMTQLSEPSDSSQFSLDISRMSDNPPKNLGHRRAFSEILTLLDDISFDSDLGVLGRLDEAEEDLLSVYLDVDKLDSTSECCSFQVGELSTSKAAEVGPTHIAQSSSEKPRVRHQHSQSMDGSTTIKSEMLLQNSEDPSQAEPRKAISAANLAELALVDPKRAKRIWANRQSAARSKERKMRYIAELEREVHALHTEAMSLSTQYNILQEHREETSGFLDKTRKRAGKNNNFKMDTKGLSSENSELKLQLQTTEQQVQLQDALNDALREEIQRLRVVTGQTIPNGRPLMSVPPSYGATQQFFANDHSLVAAQQLQDFHLHQHQHQLHHFQQQQLQLQ